LQQAGYGAYQRIQTQTSSPGELIILLYDALQTDLQRAEQGLLMGDYELVNARLSRAQEIVQELSASLDRNQGEIPEQLGALYGYIYRRLVDANVRKDVAPVREVAELVKPLREAWGAAVREVARGGMA
jgi:flagellar protein FliS